MSLLASCTCGATFRIDPELVGKTFKCLKCGEPVHVEPQEAGLVGPPPLDYVGSRLSANPQVDPIFDRDRFLLRQKVFSLNQRYTVADEQQRPIVWVVRPTHVARSALAALVAFATFFGISTLVVMRVLSQAGPRYDVGTGGVVAIVIGVVVALAAAFLMGLLLAPKRHVHFFGDAQQRERLIDVLQDSKWQPLVATYTLQDAAGNVLATFRRNRLESLIRKRWSVLAPDGSGVICRAVEDSTLLALLRRFLGPMYGLLRTNFLLYAGPGDQVIGEFNRKFTIVDRYVLDLSADPHRLLDRRIALALGVMLDTGERR